MFQIYIQIEGCLICMKGIGMYDMYLQRLQQKNKNCKFVAFLPFLCSF